MAYFGFGLIVYAIFNFLYLTVLFQSAYQVGKAFVIAIIPATAIIALMEYSVHLPSFTWLDSLQTGDLIHNRGFSMNHKTVQRLMKELGLVCRVRIKKYHSYKGEVGKIAPNLLNRNFYAEKPNQKWVTDVTEFSLFGQKMYLSPILDLHNGYLVSYTISDRPVLGMITSMLEKAFETIPDGTGLILHSDQGWQYQHKKYQHMIRRKGIRQSMSRKGNCLDNAVMENFFGLLKSELLYLQKFDSLEHFKQELVDYLDYYNNRRIKIKLKGLPPALHRQQALSVA